MFLIKAYRLVLASMITVMTRESRKRHKAARDIQAHIDALRNKQIDAQKESAKLHVEAERLKEMLG